MSYRLLEDIALNTETLGAKGNFPSTVQLLRFLAHKSLSPYTWVNGVRCSDLREEQQHQVSDVTSHKKAPQ